MEEEEEGRRPSLLPSFNSRNFLIYVWHEHEWILPVKVPAALVEAVRKPGRRSRLRPPEGRNVGGLGRRFE